MNSKSILLYTMAAIIVCGLYFLVVPWLLSSNSIIGIIAGVVVLIAPVVAAIQIILSEIKKHE